MTNLSKLTADSFFSHENNRWTKIISHLGLEPGALGILVKFLNQSVKFGYQDSVLSPFCVCVDGNQQQDDDDDSMDVDQQNYQSGRGVKRHRI
jgi:hypothetical protein